MGDREGWREAFRAFGAAAVGVLQAELALVRETWHRSMRELGKAAGLALAAGYLGLLVLPALLVFALLDGLSAGLGWPPWVAALAVAAVVAVVAFVLYKIAGRVVARRVESPVATVKHRVSDHVDWWNERVLAEGGTERVRAEGGTEGETDGDIDGSSPDARGPAPGESAP